MRVTAAALPKINAKRLVFVAVLWRVYCVGHTDLSGNQRSERIRPAQSFV